MKVDVVIRSNNIGDVVLTDYYKQYDYAPADSKRPSKGDSFIDKGTVVAIVHGKSKEDSPVTIGVVSSREEGSFENDWVYKSKYQRKVRFISTDVITFSEFISNNPSVTTSLRGMSSVFRVQ